MKYYKVQQFLFNRLNQHDDLIDDKGIIFLESSEAIITHTIEYFREPVDHLVYPAKSFAVAIIYSFLIEKNFKTSFYESLNDPELLCGNDRFYKTYYERKDVYDAIISSIDLSSETFRLNCLLSQVDTTVAYFSKEFNLSPSLLDSYCRRV
jgi:hypothetical protein